MSNVEAFILKQIEKAREDLYQAVHTSSNQSFSGGKVLNKSRKLDHLIYRYLQEEKKGERESKRKGRSP